MLPLKNALPENLKIKIAENVPIKIKALLNIPIKDYFRKDKIYIFHHIPKCGGISLQNLLRNWFVIRLDEPVKHGYNKWESQSFNIHKFKNFHLLAGHFQFEDNYIDQRYPEIFTDSRYRLFSFIRDPLSRAISLYYYSLQFDLDSDVKLVDYLFKQNNFYAKIFRINEHNLQNRLDNYFFIGTTERYDDSVKILSSLMKKQYYPLKHVNKTKKDKQLSDITAEIEQSFINQNKLDYEIYNYVNSRLSKMNEKRMNGSLA